MSHVINEYIAYYKINDSGKRVICAVDNNVRVKLCYR